MNLDDIKWSKETISILKAFSFNKYSTVFPAITFKLIFYNEKEGEKVTRI